MNAQLNKPPLSTLDDNAIRVLCAEAVGFHVHGNGPLGTVLNETVLPNFPVSLDAAITLADALANEMECKIERYKTGKWVCTFIDHSYVTDRYYSNTAPTLARAITSAYLLTKGLVTT